MRQGFNQTRNMILPGRKKNYHRQFSVEYKKLKLFVTDKYDLAKKFETDLGANLMMTILENEFNLEVELNS